MYRAYQKPSAGLVTRVLSQVVVERTHIGGYREYGGVAIRLVDGIRTQTIVKGLLMQVEFGDVVTQIVVLDGRRRNWLALSMWGFRLHLWGCHRSSC